MAPGTADANGDDTADGTVVDETQADESDGDDASDERRLFEKNRPETAAFVASNLGVTRISLAGDRVGQFTLAHRCTARSVAVNDALVVGTDDDVLVSGGDAFESTGFGPAVAVGAHEGTIYAATDDGRVARAPVDARSGDAWETVGEVEDPRRFDANLLAAADGVFRVETDGTLSDLGLEAANDVARAASLAGGGPVAATDDGVYRYDGEWIREIEGTATWVAGDGETTIAAVDGELCESVDGNWTSRPLPVAEEIADLARGESSYAITDAGTMLVHADPAVTDDGQGGWRSQAVGVRGVVEMAIR